jgi:hypothetical protein
LRSQAQGGIDMGMDTQPAARSKKVVLTFITGGATSIYIALAAWAYSAALAADMLTASITLFFAWLTSSSALALSKILGAFTPRRRILLNVICAIVLAVLTAVLGAYFYSKRPDPIPAPLLTAQLIELKNIDEFLGSREEADLRQTFDLPQIFYLNVLIWKKWANPSSITTEQSKKIDNFVKTGTGLIDKRSVRVGSTEGGGGVIEPIPGKLWSLHISVKFNAAIERLRRYETNAMVPSDVRAALKDFDTIVANNIDLIFTVMNERYAENHDSLLHDDDSSSKLFGAVSSPYWKQFTPLRPSAEKINSAIRKYLKID